MSSRSDALGDGADSASDVEMKQVASSDDEIKVIKILYIKYLTISSLSTNNIIAL